LDYRGREKRKEKREKRQERGERGEKREATDNEACLLYFIHCVSFDISISNLTQKIPRRRYVLERF
jgi:hypothetical protein